MQGVIDAISYRPYSIVLTYDSERCAMKSLKAALENLDESISDLEDRVGVDAKVRLVAQKKQADLMKQSHAREAGTLAVAQKVALRLDQAIEHVEKILKT